MIDPAGGPQEMAEWLRRLGRTLDAAAALPTDEGGVTRPAEQWPIGGRAQLLRYDPPQATRRPILIVYSLVNRPFILDLTAQRSWIRHLCAAGHPVYLLDWGTPRGADRWLTLDDYIGRYLLTAAAEITAAAGAPPHLLGVCQGGTFALCLAALRPDLVSRIVALVTPVDFHTTDDTLSRIAQEIDFARVTSTLGNIAAPWLNSFFISLKPYRLLAQRYIDLPELAERPEALEDFMRLERWMYDSPDQAATAFAQFGRLFYQENALLRGNLTLCGSRIGLEQIRAPLFAVYAQHDHLVPPAAARALNQAVHAAEYREAAYNGGHIGVFISRTAHRDVVPEVVAWLSP